MVKNKEIARRAVRHIVRKTPSDRASLVAMGDLIGLLAHLYRKSKDIRNFFVSPFVSKEKKLAVIRALMEKVGASDSALEVFEYLVDINGFGLLPEMKRLYDHEVEKLMKLSKGRLTLATDLDEEEVNRIVSTIQKQIGREIEIETDKDESLIGGFVFRTAGFVVDTSVKRQLERLMIHGG